jgi:hypothetical protein
MLADAILAPLFVQVALTFALMFWMGGLRYGSVVRRETRLADIALGQPNWPPHVTKVSNAYENQFQLPVLFYVLVTLALVLRKADLLFVILSWVFVVLRIIHAYVHTTTNNVNHRFKVFAAAAIVLLVMWIIFAIRILLGL